MHVLVGTKLNRLIFAVVVDHPGIFCLAVLSDKDVEKGVDQAVLELVEPLGDQFPIFLPCSVKNYNHLRTTLVNILVLEVLGMGQHVILAKQGIRAGDIVVASVGDQCPPTAARDIRKTDMVAGTVTPIEVSDAERSV